MLDLAPPTRWHSHSLTNTLLLAAILCCLIARPAQGIDRKYWELSPYSMRIELAVGDSLAHRGQVAESLAARIEQRIISTLHPLWSPELIVSSGEAKYQLIDDLESPELQEPIPDLFVDKQMFLSVTEDPVGIHLACREWDKSTQRWGPVLRRTVRQELMLVEECYRILRDTFAPLANIRTDSKDFSRVYLTFKGSELPSRTNEGRLLSSGQVMQPLRIRFDHTGEVLPNGVMEIPWTFLTAQQTEEGDWEGNVQSGTKRPFGIRRRGRSQYVAIAIRNPPAATQVRFYARHDQEQGLVGYEVFQRFRDDQQTEPLGLTDSSGSVMVPPADVKIITLFLRSDGQVLTKVPIPSGAKPIFEIPVPDDTARLRAQAALTAFREQLIDVVARRSILTTRIRSYTEEGDFKEARKLLAELEDLPGRARFDQDLVSAQRKKAHKSKDPRIQGRIDRLFSETRQLLGRFLDVRAITELRSELNAAEKGRSAGKKQQTKKT